MSVVFLPQLTHFGCLLTLQQRVKKKGCLTSGTEVQGEEEDQNLESSSAHRFFVRYFLGEKIKIKMNYI